jgi:tetratricopeptide (TPR) repeat protein
MIRICPACRKEFQDDVRFCAECGTRLEAKPEQPQHDAEVVISRGSIVDGGVHISKTENRTVIETHDDSRTVLTCGKCGAHVLKPEGYTCPHCERFYCRQDYDPALRCCRDCGARSAASAEQQYAALLEEIMKDGRVDAAERQRLDRAQRDLGLTVEQARTLEARTRSRIAPEARQGGIGRREQTMLEEARRRLFETMDFEEAQKIVRPLYERFGDNDEIRCIHWFSLLETHPEDAWRELESVRFDDRNKTLALVEILARRSEFYKAADILREAMTAFGDQDPLLVAADADLALEEYRSTRRQSLLDYARECLERLPAKPEHGYLLFVNAFHEYLTGRTDALEYQASHPGKAHYYAARKIRLIQQGQAARARTPAKAPESRPEPPPPKMPVAVEPPPPAPAMVPGLWRLLLVDSYGQRADGTCQVALSGQQIQLLANVSCYRVLWDGLSHFIQEQSLFVGVLNGSSIVAHCNQVVRMVDGMVVPVPGLPFRFTAAAAPGGRALQGVVVSALGESTNVQMQI